jgi:ketopantoate reductase
MYLTIVRINSVLMFYRNRKALFNEPISPSILMLDLVLQKLLDNAD